MRYSLIAISTFVAVLLFSIACTPDSPETEHEVPTETTEPASSPTADADTTHDSQTETPETRPEQDPAPGEVAAQQSASSESVANLMHSSGIFTVQIAAHRNEHMAERSAAQWNERGYSDTHVIRSTDNDGSTWHKVYLGRYASFSNAERASQMLNQEYNKGTWPRRFPQ